MGPAAPALAVTAQVVSSAITGYNVGKKLGETVSEIIRDKSLTLVNKHRHRVWVAVMYQYNGNWVIKGWFEIIPLDSFSYSFAGIKNRNVYYYVECADCDAKWGDGSGTGYVPTHGEAFTVYDSWEIGELRKFSGTNLADDDITINCSIYIYNRFYSFNKSSKLC